MRPICLNMIVRNESGRILRCLESVAPHITSWVIADTGSDDGTPRMIEEFFSQRGIPGKLVRCKFENFSQARNVALFAAQHAAELSFDYLLLIDADMELKVLNPTFLDDREAPSYDMIQIAGPLHYANRRLVKRGWPKGYLGVTHEYLDADTGGLIPPEKALMIDRADGANRPNKVKRDIALLKEGLRKEPKNERYMYYLAQSYREAGKFEKALKWYERRVVAGGWDQEVWSARYCAAGCYLQLGNEAEFIRNLLAAYNMRPTRAEPLYDLANWYRIRGENAPACMIAEAGMNLPRSRDELFVNDYVYDVGCKQEFAITAYYTPGKMTTGYKVNNFLMLKKGPYADARELARINNFHYYQPLKTFCPSFSDKVINFTAPDGYTAMNPSIAVEGGELEGIIRTVNYKIDEHGRYLIRGTDGTANATNPIHTRNFYVYFNDKLEVLEAQEIRGEPHKDLDCPLQFDLVRGYEDMRLYFNGAETWVSATVRELEQEGPCEQVRVRIDFNLIADDAVPYTTDVVRMKRRGHEKNWMPIEGVGHRFMYRCNETVDGDGNTIQTNTAPVEVDTLAGSTQVIMVADGYLAIVHEARQIPGAPTRFYSHRFVAFDNDFKLVKITPSFYFNEKGIEYAAGLCINPYNKDQFLISYGFKDREARIASVDIAEVEKFLMVN